MDKIKIYINENKVLEFNELEVEILKNQIDEKEFDKVIKNWATSIFEYRLEHSKKVLIDRWINGNPCLLAKNDVKSMPTNRDELIQLIINQPNYLEITELDKCPKDEE